MFVTEYHILGLVVTVLILAWAIIAFFLNKIDSVKKELFNHIGEIQKKLGSMDKCLARIDERTGDHERRLDKLETKVNQRER